MATLNPALAGWECPDIGDLLERARAGDGEAYCQLCQVHERGLLRQALALCGNLTLAEDLAQDTLVEAWKSLSRYNGRCRFFTWLCAILLNRYRNTLRACRRFPIPQYPDNREGFPEKLPEMASQEGWPDQEVQQQEQAAVVRRCVDALPAKQQQVIHLRFYVDDSLPEIAAALGCSVGTVKSRLFHALEKLRAMKELRGQSTIPKKAIDCL